MREESRNSLSSELFALSQAKVQIQREFEAFRSVARSDKEKHLLLLEENARLLQRLAKTKDVTDDFLARPSDGINLPSLSSPMYPPSRIFASSESHRGTLDGIKDMVAQLERSRQGILPLFFIVFVFIVITLFGVARSILLTRSRHEGIGCFFYYLGLQLFKNQCFHGGEKMIPLTESSSLLLDNAVQRVHDVPLE